MPSTNLIRFQMTYWRAVSCVTRKLRMAANSLAVAQCPISSGARVWRNLWRGHPRDPGGLEARVHGARDIQDSASHGTVGTLEKVLRFANGSPRYR